jgi:hypothetical protein
MKAKFLLAAAVLLFAFGGCRTEIKTEGTISRIVRSGRDPLLKKYEQADRFYRRLENTNLDIVSYFHRRRIGEAIVEKDYIRYMFDTKTGKLLEETRKWRDGLPEVVIPVIGRGQAESAVKGRIMTSKLYIISPQTDVFRLDPPPQNPCWIVWSKEDGEVIISIFDAMTGKFLGYGVPPPINGYAFHCSVADGWKDWRDNADEWFEKMGYPSRRSTDPCGDEVKRWIQSDDIAMFFEISHGGRDVIHTSCPNCDVLAAREVQDWMTDYASMPFALLTSCDSMCYQGTDGTMFPTFSYVLRKNSDIGTAVIGYCGMGDEPCASDCFPDSLDWQDKLLSLMSDGWPVGYAFDRANLEYPDCADCSRIGGNRLMVYVGAGGESYKVIRSLAGDLYDEEVNGACVPRLKGVYSRESYRPYYIRADLRIPSGRSLNLTPTSSRPIIDLFFMNDSKMICDGRLDADGRKGEILLVSEKDNKKGIRIKGMLRANNGGRIKIYL